MADLEEKAHTCFICSTSEESVAKELKRMLANNLTDEELLKLAREMKEKHKHEGKKLP